MSKKENGVRPFVFSLLRRIYRARPQDDDQRNPRRRDPDLFTDLFDFFMLLYKGCKVESLFPSVRGAFKSGPPTGEEVRLVREAILGRIALEMEDVPQTLVAVLAEMPQPEALAPVAELYRRAVQCNHARIAFSCLCYINARLREEGVPAPLSRRVRRILRQCLPIVQEHAQENWMGIAEMNYKLLPRRSSIPKRRKSPLLVASGREGSSGKTKGVPGTHDLSQ